MPQIVTGFDRYAQEARAQREERRRATLDAAAETRAVAQDRRQQTTFDLALKDRETALANQAEDRKALQQERWGKQFQQDVAVLGTLAQPVPIELVPGVQALMPPDKAAGAKYATFSRNAEGVVTGVDYYAEEGDPAPMYQVGLDAEGLMDRAASNWKVFESQVTRDAQNNLTANTVMVNDRGEARLVQTPIGKDISKSTEKAPTPQQEALAASAIAKQQQAQALENTKKALAPVRLWMVEAGYGSFKDAYEAKANLELMIQIEEQYPQPNASKLTAMKRALTNVDSIIGDPVDSIIGDPVDSIIGDPAASSDTGAVDEDIFKGTGLTR